MRAGRWPVASLGVPHGGVDGRAGGVCSVQVGQRRGGEHGVGRVRPREWCWGERDHRTAVYCEVPSAAMVEEPD